MLATIEKGDEIIIPSPYWVSYPDITLLADGHPVAFDCSLENNFKINPKDLESKILRFIGKPQKRIKEDYIRIVRYFRFLSNYSNNINKFPILFLSLFQ